MARKVLIVLVTITVVGLVVGVIVNRPAIRVGQLSRALSHAATAGDAAQTARELLKIGSGEATSAVADYAAASDLRAFDARHEILLIHEPTTGQTHIVHVRPRGEPIDTGDPGLDRAIEAATPETKAESFGIGESPQAFAAVRVAESADRHVEFLLEAEDEAESYRYRFTFEGDRLASEGLLTGR